MSNIHETDFVQKEHLSKLNTLLNKAIETEGADKGTLQVYDRAKSSLYIVAQKNFDAAFLEYFKIVKPFDSSACGRACGSGNVVVINNIKEDVGFAPHFKVVNENGICAVKSIPLKNKTGKFVGVLSVHFKQPHWQTDTQKISPVINELAELLTGTAVRMNPIPNTNIEFFN
jgi:hypothetical protein